MKFLKVVFAGFCLAALLSGCATTDSKDSQKEANDQAKKIKSSLAKIEAKEVAEAKKFAETQADNFFQAFKFKDYDAFCKSKKISREEFDKWHEAVSKVYGKLENQKYIGKISNQLVIRYMWRWEFSKKVKGENCTLEALYNVFIAKDKKDGKYILFTSGLQ